MAYSPIQVRTFEFVPTTYVDNEVRSLWLMPQGTAVLATSGLILEAFDGTSAKVELGVTTIDPDGFIDEDDWDEAVVTTYTQGKGALLVGSVPNIYVVYTAAGDMLAVNFEAGTTGTTGKARFRIATFKLGV